MYKSPIKVFTDELSLYYDNNIVEAVQRYDINVDKDELLKALRYDRQQYDKGFADGKIAAIDEIVRCKDCKLRDTDGCYMSFYDDTGEVLTLAEDDDYCSKGKRRTEDE